MQAHLNVRAADSVEVGGMEWDAATEFVHGGFDVSSMQHDEVMRKKEGKELRAKHVSTK